MACIVNRGCGGIDGFCNMMHVFYGACEVIVGGDDGESIRWCCRCKELAHSGDSRLSGAAIEGDDATGHVIVDMCFDDGCNGGCYTLSGKEIDEVLIGQSNRASNYLFANVGCLPSLSCVVPDLVGVH